MSRKLRLPTLTFGLSPVKTECQRQFGVYAVYAQIRIRERGSRGRGSFYASFHIKGTIPELERDFAFGRHQLEIDKDKDFESWILLTFDPFSPRDFINDSIPLVAGWKRHDDIIQPTPGPLGQSFQRPCSWFEPGSIIDSKETT